MGYNKRDFDEKVLDAELALPNETDGKIYHYTSSETLGSIINSQCLWFTDCEFLNDPREQNDLYEIFNDFIGFCGEKLYGSDFCNLLKSLVQKKLDKSGNVIKYNSTYKDRFKYFVFSCCENSDNWSLWLYNYYNIQTKITDPNKKIIGCNLRLWSNDFQSMVFDDPSIDLRSSKVIYDKQDKYRKLESIISPLYDFWYDDAEKSEALKMKIKTELGKLLSDCSLFFKTYEFAPEEECRFVIKLPIYGLRKKTINNKGKTSNLYIPKGKDINPHIIVPFTTVGKGIYAIKISPIYIIRATKSEEERIINIFKRYGYDNTKVSFSTMELRR